MGVLPAYRRLTLLVSGITPLLMHNWKGIMRKGRKDAEICKLPPVEQAKEGLYLMEDGQLYLPAASLKCAIIDAGRERKDGLRSLATTLIRSLSFVRGDDGDAIEELPLFSGTTGAPLMQDDWELHESPVWTHRKKRKYVRGRAMVKDWACVAQLDVFEEYWKGRFGLIVKMARTAGLQEGLLDGRNKGMYSPPAPLRFPPDLLKRIQAGGDVHVGEFGRFVVEEYDGERPPRIARFVSLREKALAGLSKEANLQTLIAGGVDYA